MTVHTIRVFMRFERIWHWAQMASIMTLIFTGFRIHGFYEIIPFRTAVTVHTWTAIFLLALWAFATFWLFTTGQWKHYLPTADKLLQVARYYAWGIFRGENHPYRKTYRRKHNPLQALTYLAIKVVIFPAVWISGITYLLISFGQEGLLGPLTTGLVATVHTIAAFAIVVFVIAHIYLLTTGHSFIEHLKPMITGYDKVDLTDEELAFLETSEPGALKKD